MAKHKLLMSLGGHLLIALGIGQFSFVVVECVCVSILALPSICSEWSEPVHIDRKQENVLSVQLAIALRIADSVHHIFPSSSNLMVQNGNSPHCSNCTNRFTIKHAAYHCSGKRCG